MDSNTQQVRWSPRLLALRATDLLFPNCCAACGHTFSANFFRVALCPGCATKIQDLSARPYCSRCGRSSPITAIHENNCAACRREHHWNLRKIVRVGDYRDPLRSLILGLKYAGQQRNAVVLGELLAGALRSCAWFSGIDAILPVPMHWKRRLQRPCDHAMLLAREVRRRLDVPMIRAVRRVRYAPSQTDLVRSQRFENVAGCFAPRWSALRMHARRRRQLEGGGSDGWITRMAERWILPLSVSGKRVCIIDNLMTTGATIQEVAKATRRAGASAVYAAILACADPQQDGLVIHSRDGQQQGAEIEAPAMKIAATDPQTALAQQLEALRAGSAR